MVPFRIKKGLAQDLPQDANSYIEGYCYFTIDDGKFYIDTTNDETGRVTLNAEQADKLKTTGTIEVNLENNEPSTYTNGGDIAPGVSGILQPINGGTGNTTGRIQIGQKEGEILGTNATSEGNNTIASGDYSHAEGNGTKASGNYSHAEGCSTYPLYSLTINGDANATTYQIISDTFAYSITNTSDSNNYGFILNNNGYYESQNFGIHNSYALCRVMLDVPTTTDITFSVINYAEGSYDFALFSQLDTTLTASYTVDSSNIFKSFKGLSNSSIQTVTYSSVTAGTHTIDIKFRKDSSANSNNDSVQFKIDNGIDNTDIINSLIGKNVIYNSVSAKIINTSFNSFIVDHTLSSSSLNSASVDIVALGEGASGDYSHVEGMGTKAINIYSHAEGYNTTASGEGSHSEGNGTTASGKYSHAKGYKTSASGDYSYSEGYNTTASGEGSHAEGMNAIASGDYSHAGGNGTTAPGEGSYAEGNGTTASGDYSHAEGTNTTASGDYSHAEGSNYTNTNTILNDRVYDSINISGSLSYGNSSHAEGVQTLASGYSSHAEGFQTNATGSNSHAEGYRASATGDYSHAEGDGTTASGDYSHAEGINVIASGEGSHAEGDGTTASGDYSHAEGINVIASGEGSHAGGTNTLASGDYAVIFGERNDSRLIALSGAANTLTYSINAPYLKASALQGEVSSSGTFTSTILPSAVSGSPTSVTVKRTAVYTLNGGCSYLYTTVKSSTQGNNYFTPSIYLFSSRSGNNFSGLIKTYTANTSVTETITVPENSTYYIVYYSGWTAYSKYSSSSSSGTIYYYRSTANGTAKGTPTIRENINTENILIYQNGYFPTGQKIVSISTDDNTITVDKTLSTSQVTNKDFLIYLDRGAKGNASFVTGLNNSAKGSYQTVIGKNNLEDTTSAFIIGNGNNADNFSNAYIIDWNGNSIQTGTNTSTNFIGPLTGNADTATKWATARTINITDADGTNTGTAITIDGTKDATLKLPTTIKANLTGNATSSDKLNTDAGNSGLPVWFSNGIPQSCDRTLNVDINGNADTIDSYHGIDLVKYNDALLTVNPFGGKKLYISRIDNAFYAADIRYNVTAKIYDKATGNELRTVSSHKLFNGKYDEAAIIVTPDEILKVTIDFTQTDWGFFGPYGYGYFYSSFYHTDVPETTSVRVYSNYTDHTVGWYDLSVEDISQGYDGGKIISAHNHFYKVEQIEFTYSSSTNNVRISEIECFLDRGQDSFTTPVINKYEPETLYYALTAPEFKGKLTGNADTATALTSNAGNSTLPIYFKDGKPIACDSSLVVNITGNADTATKLATARTISLTGDVTGSGSFDGLDNLSITTTVADDSHNHSNYMTDSQSISVNSDFNTITKSGVYRFSNISDYTNAPPQSWGQMLVLHGSGDTINQLAFDYSGANAWIRGGNSSDVGGTGSWYDWKRIWCEGNSITGAVWNDYAEYRESNCEEFGYVLMENGDDTLSKTTERLSHFAGISSDTWGFSQGETARARTPIAVAGRVLVYPYQDRNNYKPGDCVCAAPNGTVDIMTREEIINWPDRIVGTVSCVPQYEEWGGGQGADRPSAKVNGRIWIKVK